MANRRPIWPVVTAALVLLPVVYVLSFGPACWVSSRTGNDSMLVFHQALIQAGTRTIDQPKLYRTPLQRILKWYADLGADNFSKFDDDRIYWAIFEGR